MKNLMKIPQYIRLYGITLSIIWYLFGMSFMLDACKEWSETALALNNTEICLEYLFASLTTTLILSYGVEYILKKDIVN